jgi:DNA repair protein RadA/Sms
VHPPSNVLYALGEDGAADTFRPRFEAAGGDPDRCFLIDQSEASVSFPSYGGRLLEHVERIQAKLVVIDPLTAYFGAGIDNHREVDVRRALAPLKALAAKTGAAVVLVRHLNKGASSDPLQRAAGSIAITALSRTGLLVARNPDDSSQTLVSGFKNNLGVKPPTLAFRLVKATVTGVETCRVEWLGHAYSAEVGH